MVDKRFAQKVIDFITPVDTLLPLTGTVQQALAELRTKKIQQKIIYFYVVDNHGTLKGVVSTRNLLLADPQLPVAKIMQSAIVTLQAEQTVQEALELFAAYPLLAIPVVNNHGLLLGTIDVQKVTGEAVDVTNSKDRLDAFQIVGLTLEDGQQDTLQGRYRIRMPWLLCNVFAGLICALISLYFGAVLEKQLLLAFFIPLVLTLSESTSMQAMTQSLLFIRRPRFSWKMALLRAVQEWQLAAVIALNLGVLVGVLSLFWGGGFVTSFCIGIGILCSIIFSAIFGIAIPLFLHLIKMDPKVAAGPVVLMITDILTTALYLALSTWLLL